MKTGWYFEAEVHNFFGFYHHLKDEGEPPNGADCIYGPYKTFSEAKKEAIGFFRADVIEAQRCITAIKKARKNK